MKLLGFSGKELLCSLLLGYDSYQRGRQHHDEMELFHYEMVYMQGRRANNEPKVRSNKGDGFW